jgi:hypothetical protein
VQIGKLTLVQNPADEQTASEAPEEHDVTRVLDAAEAGSNTFAASAD